MASGYWISPVAPATLTVKFSRLVGPTGEVVLADISDSMLKVGRDKLTDRGAASNVRYAQADAQYLPFPDNTFDCITIVPSACAMSPTKTWPCNPCRLRVLKPWPADCSCWAPRRATSGLLGKFYDFYSFNLLPRIGQLVAHDADSYQYLAESIRMHPDQETLKKMMADARLRQPRLSQH